MPKDRSGYTVLEMMIAISVSTLLMTGMLMLVRQFQLTASGLQCLLEREQNLRLAPLILSRLVPHSGNQRWRWEWAGLTWQGEELEIRSDVDGSQGFPDGEAASSYEDIRLRARDQHLQIRSGRGNFQPFLRNITRLETALPSAELLQINLSGQTDPMPLRRGVQASRQAEIVFWLRNFQTNLFAEDPQ